MVTLSSRPLHRITRWSLFGCLLLLVLILTACGDSGSTQSSTSSQNSTASNSNSSSSATMTGNSAGTLQTVKITEVQATNGGKDQYSFSPNTLSVKMGDMVTFVNQTDENHTLTSNIMGGFPDGSLISKNETQIIHFAKDGTYTIHSVEHHDATMTVTVK